MVTTEQFSPFTGSVFNPARHICAFFNGVDEQHHVLRPFIKEGFDRGDKAYHLVDPELREDHLRRLAEAGINVQAALGTGQLEVRLWQDGPLSGGHFDKETWLQVGTVLRDTEGRLLGEYFFRDVRLNPDIPASQFKRGAL